MEYFTTAEIAEKWGVSRRRVTVLCDDGRVAGAVKKGKMWLIPENVQKPVDRRSVRYSGQ